MLSSVAPPLAYQIARFWAAVDTSGGPDACWPWTLSTYIATGYGQATTIRQLTGSPRTASTLAHRQAWIIAHGNPGTHVSPRSGQTIANRVLHRCPGGENRLCCNPAHLAVGTDQDNADDRRRGSNHPHGERLGTSKLTVEQVREIRRLHASGAGVMELARRFGVAHGTIGPVIRHETWRNV